MWASKHVQSAVINTSVINQQCRENKARVSLRECPFIAEYEWDISAGIVAPPEENTETRTVDAETYLDSSELYQYLTI